MPPAMGGGIQRALTLNSVREEAIADMQRIEFGDGSAAIAALAEAFDRFQRIVETFDPSEIRAAAAVASGPGWARPPRKPPPLRLAVCPVTWNRFQRTVKASGS